MSDTWSDLRVEPFGMDIFNQRHQLFDELEGAQKLQDDIPEAGLAAEMPDLFSAEVSDFLSIEVPACSLTGMPAFPSTETPTFLLVEMPASPNPPSPLASAGCSLKTKYAVMYADAVNRGNVLLCLDHHIRRRIYSYLLADYTEIRNIEVPETKDFAKTFPDFCHSLDIIYFDVCLLMVQNTTFTISSDGAIFNLMVFLNEFPNNEGYNAVRSLEFSGRTVVGTQEETALGLFEKGVFTSNATELLHRCPNVKKISLIISLSDLSWNYGGGYRELKIAALTNKYDIASITAPTQLEVITLSLKPFMALKKTVQSMEDERETNHHMDWMKPGLNSFWGLKDWFELQALEQMKLIEVRCPSLYQLG